MKRFELLIDKEALTDIQKATDWYNEQLPGLGTRFQSQVRGQLGSLKANYHAYSLRYKNVRCMLIRKFPYLVHFSTDEINCVVEVFAVIHTSRHPKIWLKKRKRSKR